MPKTPVKPFLIDKDEEGRVRLTIRETRFNMQNYPIVTATRLDETFTTSAAARAHAAKHFGAEPGQFAAK